MPRYSNAPIIQAIMDLRIQSDVDWNEELSQKIIEQFKTEFPMYRKVLHNSVSVGNQITHTIKETGIRFDSEDGRFFLQMEPEGFTFSIIRDYQTWSEFSKMAFNLLAIYEGLFQPRNTTRQALRYINVVEIPQSNFDLKDYFEVYPHVFNDNSDTVTGLDLRVSIQSPLLNNGHSLITQRTLSSSPDSTNILLDIDVIEKQNISFNIEILKDSMLRLRTEKNRIFEAAITDKTRELIS